MRTFEIEYVGPPISDELFDEVVAAFERHRCRIESSADGPTDLDEP